MSSLITRSAVLTFSRISNYAIMLFSPIFLVRLLDVQQFGQYREFMLYAMLLSVAINFSINKSLTYFLPKFPAQERIYVTQTILFVFLFSVMGFVFVYFGKEIILALTSFDFIVPLVLFVFFFLNLDFLELYWLAKRRSDYVLYYSGGRLAVRMIVVIFAAYYTRNVQIIIHSLIAVEAIRFALVGFWAVRRKLLVTTVRLETLKQQLLFFAPLGIAGIIVVLNKDVGKVFISTNLGVTALALYAIGTYTVPIVNIFRSSISDVIFPEMVDTKTGQPRDTLELWQRATVLYCFLLFPIVAIFFYYADVIVVTLFTDAYSECIPIFIIYLFAIVRECFDFNLPLRAMNKNVYTLIGDMLALVLNISLMLLLFDWLGLIGPAVAYVTADVIMAIYLGRQVIRLTGVSLTEILPWGQLGIVLLACLLGVPILFVGEQLAVHEVLRAILVSTIYGLVYILLIKYAGVREVTLILERFAAHLRRS